jgi:hypothetical protein
MLEMLCTPVGLDFLPVAGQKKMTRAAPWMLKRERLHATPTRLAGRAFGIGAGLEVCNVSVHVGSHGTKT